MAQGPTWLNVAIFTTGPDGAQVVTPATILVLSSASPPPRPTPPPGGQPPLGIWGPGDPRPTLPIAGWDPGTGNFPGAPGGGQPPLVIWGPGDPRPTLPIAGWDPGTGNFPTPPGGGGGGDLPPQVVRPPSGESPGVAVVKNADPAGATPPADMPGAVYSDIYFGRGTLPTKAWIAPYAQQQ
jgi:hypothetical protein